MCFEIRVGTPKSGPPVAKAYAERQIRWDNIKLAVYRSFSRRIVFLDSTALYYTDALHR